MSGADCVDVGWPHNRIYGDFVQLVLGCGQAAVEGWAHRVGQGSGARSRSSLCPEQPLNHRTAGTPPSTSSDVPCLSHGLFASCLG